MFDKYFQIARQFPIIEIYFLFEFDLNYSLDYSLRRKYHDNIG